MIINNCPVDVAPYEQSSLVKNNNIVNLNYTNQDFDSLKSRLVDFILQKFGPNGSDFPNTFADLIESQLAFMLIESWAFLADTLSFKIDQIANELFIDTVTQVENIFRLAKLVGFYPQPPISSRSLWVGTLQNPITTEIRIPTPVPVDFSIDGTAKTIELFQADENNNPIFDEDIIIPSGATTIRNVIGLEGVTTIDNFVGNGEVGQSYELGTNPVIYDSIRVEVDGVMWDRVEYFTDSQPRREYRVEFDSSWTAFVIFGNNRAGLLPSEGSQIVVTYRVGGGVSGNIVSGFLEKQQQVFIPGLTYSITVNFRNYTRGEFGYDGDTLEDVRRKLPVYLTTQNRAVTIQDYKILAEQFATPYNGQISKATAVLRNFGCAGNVIDLYVLARENVDFLIEANNQLKVELKAEIDSKKMITDYVCIRDGVVVEVDISFDVTMDKFYKKFELEFRRKIQSKIEEFFSINNWDYGKTLRESDMIKTMSEIKEIQNIDISFTTNDPENSGSVVTTKFYEIIRPDDIAIQILFI